MSLHRIDKYTRQIVCQDMILSCQSNHVEEIPLFQRARISKLCLLNRHPVFDRELLSAKDLNLSGMLVNWHLWNKRGIPFSDAEKNIHANVTSPKIAGGRVNSDKNGRMCECSLTLRKRGLYMAIEKYLLFLMPREYITKRGIKNQEIFRPVLYNQFVQAKLVQCHKDRIFLSALYFDTALNVRQYKLNNEKVQKAAPPGQWKVVSPEKICFPCMHNNTPTDLFRPVLLCNQKPDSLMQRAHSQSFFYFGQASLHIERGTAINLVERLFQNNPSSDHHSGKRSPLSLYCPSILNSPDIQDIAQSGLITVEARCILDIS